jgi:hypothetical protein
VVFASLIQYGKEPLVVGSEGSEAFIPPEFKVTVNVAGYDDEMRTAHIRDNHLKQSVGFMDSFPLIQILFILIFSINEQFFLNTNHFIFTSNDIGLVLSKIKTNA